MRARSAARRLLWLLVNQGPQPYRGWAKLSSHKLLEPGYAELVADDLGKVHLQATRLGRWECKKLFAPREASDHEREFWEAQAGRGKLQKRKTPA